MKTSTAPIKSPYDLIQEHYWPDAWKMMVCCMLLNLTTRTQVDKIIKGLFRKYPNAKRMSLADEGELASMIVTLGLSNKRARSLIRMSAEWRGKRWERPIDVHGIGQYAQDAYDMFVHRKIIGRPADHKLKKYAYWMIHHTRIKSKFLKR